MKNGLGTVFLLVPLLASSNSSWGRKEGNLKGTSVVGCLWSFLGSKREETPSCVDRQGNSSHYMLIAMGHSKVLVDVMDMSRVSVESLVSNHL